MIRVMLHANRPDGTSIGADAGSGEWTGEKRRKHLGSSDSPPAQGDQEDPFFTIADLEDCIISLEEEMELTKLYNKKAFVCVNESCILDDEPQRHVYQRLLLYRLKAHELSKWKFVDKLDYETLQKELPDFLGKEAVHISQLHLDVDNYYRCLEKDEGGSLGWYFDPEFSKLKDLADYQRLVLKNHDDVEYLDWKGYRLIFSTHQMDKEYVKFCTEMSKKLQWLKKYIGTKGTCEWLNMEFRGRRHALKLAIRYPGVIGHLVHIAYDEHIWSLHNDYLFCEDWDIIFLEIWKLVIKKKWEFTPALIEVEKKKYVPRHDLTLQRILSLRDRISDLKSKFDFCVKGIPHDAEDGVAKESIKNEILKLPRKKTLHQYKVKKMEIAESISLHEDCGRPPMATYRELDDIDIIVITEAGQPSSLYPVKYA